MAGGANVLGAVGEAPPRGRAPATPGLTGAGVGRPRAPAGGATLGIPGRPPPGPEGLNGTAPGPGRPWTGGGENATGGRDGTGGRASGGMLSGMARVVSWKKSSPMPESGAFQGAEGWGTGGDGALVAAMPSAYTPGLVDCPLGGSGAVPNFSKGSNPPSEGAGPGDGDTAGRDVTEGDAADSRVTRKVWLHLVQRTLTPLSVTFSSGILNRVWHCSHLTIIRSAREYRPQARPPRASNQASLLPDHPFATGFPRFRASRARLPDVGGENRT
ncbi:hypothetical protein DB31_2941 [Hyalangium minutum]|uniref:Uncharacterized protein n=1 Tax=Hyalangium minutum TaxID=394096 RepID=A0A085W5B9_9BACT|nr:hypothetical protein DB31_2941 [Hyalangium minutum]